ncbi:MAG TPA: XdhC family protein [Candidatus Angelobacter sp.]
MNKVAELIAHEERFAVATVVRCEPPTSAKPGDKAIILADGTVWGWIGGGCAQPVVAAEAQKAMAEGKSRLVRLSPSAIRAETGVVDYPMTCHSGGAMDIYVEPVLARPHLLLLGRSPVAQILARLAAAIDYVVIVVVCEADATNFAEVKPLVRSEFDLAEVKVTPQTCIVVSTQGEGDEDALAQALKTNAGYIGFVASKTKAQKVFDYLKQKGIAAETLNRVRSPAGLNLGSRSPEEIAISILAEMIQFRAAQTQPAASPRGQEPRLDEDRDPICGMAVDPARARHKSEYQGLVFYFCCAGCKEAFDQQPQKYLHVAKS